MKKILIGITFLLITLLFNQKVYASSFDISLVGNDTFDDEITIYLQVDNLVDFNGSCKGLCGLVGKLNYDTNKIELVSINALEDFDLTNGKTMVLYKATGVGNNTKILEMKFKNKSLKLGETINISLSNIVASDGDKDINTSDISKIIKLVEKRIENNNNNNNSNNVNKQNINKKEEIIKSNNNYLSSIILSDGNIKFDKEKLTYDIIVSFDIKVIEINAEAEDEKSIITGLGKFNLKVGSNIIKLTVKAEDESERIYTLNVNREKKGIVVQDDNKIEENKNISNNYFIYITIGGILIVGIIGLVIWKNKNKK